jgi:4-amino-4-deoxy-L-arabinose transferase-like glycosyltransferase
MRVAYPPTFFALQGAWLWLGSPLFRYDLAVNHDLINSLINSTYTNSQTSLGIFPFWGMIPILAALFLLVGIAYKELRNKWLALICFGPITFVSVIIMGQIDVVCVLFIFVSMIVLQRALKAEKYFSLLLLGYLALGVSMQFKTYGGLLLPAYAIYTLALVRTRKLDTPKSLLTLGSCLATFLVAMFIVWLPYPAWFSAIILHGESGYLLSNPSLLFQVPVLWPAQVLPS